MAHTNKIPNSVRSAPIRKPPTVKTHEQISNQSNIATVKPSTPPAVKSVQLAKARTSVTTEKINGKVALTIHDANGKIIFEHPPKKSIIYNAALNIKAIMHKLSQKV